MSFIKSKWGLRAQQCRALFIKRFKVSKRNLLPMFFEMIMPILVLLIAELYAKYQIENRDTKFMVAQKPLNFTQTLYGNGTKFYYGLWDNSSTKYLNALVNEPGPGVRCVNGLHLKSFLGYLYFHVFIILFKNFSHSMECDKNAATDKLNFQKEWNISRWNISSDSKCYDPSTVQPSPTPSLLRFVRETNKAAQKVDSNSTKCDLTYDVPQTCGCAAAGGWNCTYDEYPIDDLQRTRFNTTDIMFSLTRRNISQFRMMTFDNTTEKKEPM